MNRRPHSQPGAHAGWPAALLGGQLGFLEAYVNQGARAFCLHVNRRPHSQPANTPSARFGTFETRVNRAHGHADLHVKGEFRPPQRGPPQGPRGLSGYTRNPKIIISQNCIDFDTKTYRFGHISGPSYRGAHAGWPAGWLVLRMPAMCLGHKHASKTRTLSTKVRRKRVPLGRKSFPKRGCLVGFRRIPK